MAEWAVIADRIALFSHPNADALLLGRVGHFQVVVAKSNDYQDGDIVVFAPERSVLPEDLRAHYVNSETGLSYLTGSDHDRVQRVRLRGEYSEGVTIDGAWVLAKLGLFSVDQIPLDTDLSAVLGITKYEPPIPMHMAGDVEPLQITQWHQHDVEQWGIYAEEFQVGEMVNVTEKLHGSQTIVYVGADGSEIITSKGLSGKGLVLKPSETNVYWQAVRNLNLFARLRDHFPGQDVQAFGEVIPVQKGFSYGQTRPVLRLFRVVVDGRELASAEIPSALWPEWVPTLYAGPFDRETITSLAKGMEQVSGRNLHIREGIVISPAIPRRASKGFPLYLKVINPKFKDSEEFVS